MSNKNLLGFLPYLKIHYLGIVGCAAILDSGNKTAINVKHNDLMHNSKRASVYGFSKQVDKYMKALKAFEALV